VHRFAAREAVSLEGVSADVIKALSVLAIYGLRFAAINPALGQREARRFRFSPLFERGFYIESVYLSLAIFAPDDLYRRLPLA
jgi:hypothetical protein